jgi:predicted XRE-type DNA-binding protein
MAEGIDFTRSSGNVFADMGFENAEEELLKAELTLQIRKAIRDKGLSRQAAAQLIGVSEQQAGALMHNRSGRLSVGRLMQALTRLDRDIEVTVRPKAAGCDAGHVSLVVQS